MGKPSIINYPHFISRYDYSGCGRSTRKAIQASKEATMQTLRWLAKCLRETYGVGRNNTIWAVSWKWTNSGTGCLAILAVLIPEGRHPPYGLLSGFHFLLGTDKLYQCLSDQLARLEHFEGTSNKVGTSRMERSFGSFVKRSMNLNRLRGDAQQHDQRLSASILASSREMHVGP